MTYVTESWKHISLQYDTCQGICCKISSLVYRFTPERRMVGNEVSSPRSLSIESQQVKHQHGRGRLYIGTAAHRMR